MKNVILYDPSICSLNCGDEVIVQSAKKHIFSTIGDAHYTEISTHMPLDNSVLDWFNNISYSFVCGTNLLKYGLVFGKKMWNFKWNNIKHMKQVVLVGCGWFEYQQHMDVLSKHIWNSVLSHDYMHSVRDDYTEQQMRRMGFTNIINTGCPTMWDFTNEFCNGIQKTKAKNVITTLTYYRKNITADQEMLDILSEHYEKVYLWLQGYYDLEYSKLLRIPKNTVFVPNNLSYYDDILDSEDVEYIGTRLHGGIRAMQYKKRCLIIAVDNRALEKKKSFNLNVIERGQETSIPEYIYSEYNTSVHLNIEKINSFLSQFI